MNHHAIINPKIVGGVAIGECSECGHKVCEHVCAEIERLTQESAEAAFEFSIRDEYCNFPGEPSEEFIKEQVDNTMRRFRERAAFGMR